MSTALTLQTVGDWSKRLEIPLQNALSASVEMLGISGYDACQKAIVYMAKSAAKETPKSKEFREVVRNPNLVSDNGRRRRRKAGEAKFGFYTYPGGKKTFNPIYGADLPKYMVRFASASTGQPLIKNMITGKVNRDTSNLIGGVETARSAAKRDGRLRIKNWKLAQKSWMWGLKGFSQKAIPGVTDVQSFTSSFAGSQTVSGLVLTDRINYITRIIPAGLVETVTRKATTSIMDQVARKVEKRFSVEVPRLAARRTAAAQKKLDKVFDAYFKKRGV